MAGCVTVLRANFRLSLPTDVWVTELSTRFPEATFRLLTGVPKEDRAIELGEIRCDDPTPVFSAFRDHADIVAFDQLLLSDERAVAKYEADEERLYEFLWCSSVPPEFPIEVQDGDMVFGITATREQFEGVVESLDASGFEYELLSVVHSDQDADLLTATQRAYLTAAQRKGYFDVPRTCTLAELAADLGVDKSTASETIRRATSRVVDQHLLVE